MPFSQVEIVNLAHTRIKAPLITSINEQNAAEAKAFWNGTRDKVLSDAPWKFAKKRAQLSRLAETPDFDWSYYYQLPADYIRMISVKDNEPYEEEGDRLATDASEIYIKYVWRETRTGLWHPKFVEAFACRLAHLLAIPKTGSKSLKDICFKEYDIALHEALLDNAFETEDEQVEKTDSWIQARIS